MLSSTATVAFTHSVHHHITQFREARLTLMEMLIVLMPNWFKISCQHHHAPNLDWVYFLSGVIFTLEINYIAVLAFSPSFNLNKYEKKIVCSYHALNVYILTARMAAFIAKWDWCDEHLIQFLLIATCWQSSHLFFSCCSDNPWWNILQTILSTTLLYSSV